MKAYKMLLVDEQDFFDLQARIYELRDVIYDGETYPMPVKTKHELNKQINKIIELLEET